MAKHHGAKQQKRLAKQRAKRQAKRTVLARRSSKDPTVRLQHVDRWPIIEAFVSTDLWDDGIGYLTLAREDPEGATIFAMFLVDVFCLGVKNASWDVTTREDYREIVRQMEKVQRLSPISPACLAKIVTQAVEYAGSLGFSPHPDYRHASLLLEGIDPSTCPERFEFGQNGKPLYIQGPHESPAQVRTIVERMQEVGGHFMLGGPGGSLEDLVAIEDDFDDEDDVPDDSTWTWHGPGSDGPH